MGKNQSKHWECFGSHGHFNPLAVTEEELLVIRSFSKVESTTDQNCGVAMVKVDSGLDDTDKCPLQVILPPEGARDSDSCATKRKMSETTTLPDTDKNANELSVEEFECNVSVKADTGMERQEFLFTLYDLDGHGKITKDDIAGLVRSIYEAVGTSIKLPATGSKTIKVRLTVSPDKKSSENSTKPGTESEQQKPKDSVADDTHERLVRCLSVLGGVNKEPEKPECPTPPPPPPPREPNCHHRHLHHHHHENDRNEAAPCASPRRKTRFTSAASLQRNELLEILQANLEKNSLGYQPIRKHQRPRQQQQQQHQPHRHTCGLSQPHGHNHNHHHHRNRTVECRDRRNHYLDLAGVENFAVKLGNVHLNRHEPPPVNTDETKDGPACPYLLLDRTHVCSKAGRRAKKGHHRSRSHDLNGGANPRNHVFFQREAVDDEDVIWHRINSKNNNNKNNCLNHEYGRSKSYDASNWGCGAVPGPQVPETTSPRVHNRHRHKEKEHARAMQQVAHWIQKGHIGGVTDSADAGPAEPPDPNAPSPGKNGNQVLVERHEHHHVHHHHHYHYQEL